MNAISNVTSWKKMITEMTEKSKQLWPLLKTDYGYKYTVNDDAEKQPAALLYGTWSAVMRRTIQGSVISEADKEFIRKRLLQDRLADGTFFQRDIIGQGISKVDFVKLVCRVIHRADNQDSLIFAVGKKHRLKRIALSKGIK